MQADQKDDGFKAILGVSVIWGGFVNTPGPGVWPLVPVRPPMAQGRRDARTRKRSGLARPLR